MPDFGHPFAGLAAGRRVTHEELVRTIRFTIAAEYEAVQLYTQLAESTDNLLAQRVLREIANEELVHVGEFLRLLKELAPDEAGYYAEGEAEVEEIMTALAGGQQTGPASSAGTGSQTVTETAEVEGTNPGEEEEQAQSPPESVEKSEPEKPHPPSLGGIGNLYGKL